MGIIAVAFMFGKRSCSWLPGNRVKNTIAQNEIIYGDSIKDLLDCSQYTSSDIFELLDSRGDIDFSESEPNETPKKYVFYGNNNIKVKFALFEGYSELIEINASCSTKKSNEHKQTLPLPKNIVTSIIESHAFTFYPEAECEIDCYHLNESEVRAFHKTAEINMEKSQPWPKGSGEDVINKLYYLEGKLNNTDYAILYEIGENRTRIKHILGPTTCDCY